MNVSKKSKRKISSLRPIVLLGLVIAVIFSAKGQSPQYVDVSFLFYNTENLFDCDDDSLSTGDDEYLPASNRHWTHNRYNDKLQKTAKVILASGGWSAPDLVGLCEIENRNVVDNLLFRTGLVDAGYKSVHYESPDARGIDVALLYKKKSFKVLDSKPLKVSLSNNRSTRDILLVKGILNKRDTLWIFVNHWPSRRGGEDKSSADRFAAANVLVHACDSLRTFFPSPKILAMGDFNDGPTNESIKHIEKNGLVNLATLDGKKHLGSNKFKQDWELIDQILVSQNFIESMTAPAFSVVQLPFLLEKDETNMGIKPFRTYLGPSYKGGFSDHLPVIAKFSVNNP